MADYKELLRRAISALPENNGAARRAVYEKARSALVGQLRAIQPPLPAREITQHRLQLEDCIRQVEQEASEAVISLGRDPILTPKSVPSAPAPDLAPEPITTPVEPPPVVEPLVRVAPSSPVNLSPVPKPAEKPAPESVAFAPEVEPGPEQVVEPVEEADPPAVDPERDGPLSIEEIIGEAASTTGAKVEPVEKPFVNPFLASSGDADSMPSAPAAPVPLKRPSILSRRDASAAVTTAANVVYPSSPITTRVEPSLGSAAALARQTIVEPEIVAPAQPVETALSSVREVEVDQDDAREAETVIERAIETLDREARGEPTDMLPEQQVARPPLGSLADEAVEATSDDTAAEDERRSGAGLTIFLIVFALLLVGAGGAGFWAWREGYIDLNQMFGQNTEPAVAENSDIPTPTTPTLDAPTVSETTTGPGNTATTTTTEPTTAIQGIDTEDRLEPTPDAVTPNGTETVLPSLDGGETKTEERLSGADTSIANADDPANSVDPSVLAGSQSLLLEASADGRTGAVPFSGTVEWSKGEDELGLPTLVGEASIPARNLNVTLTVRKNSDPSLPASHLLEVNFDVNDTFVGGSISSLPGVLLKNEELVPGTPLVGASARIVGNSFLFALSASPDDLTTNTNLLESRRWLDLAIVYGTGRNAILTLEKDQEAQNLFTEVFTAWGE
ncbi:hypothetical protein VW35_19955 [Devosia soli]|uniref:Uncharacterized protein n=1 Tax=Devosia soli TaxID=361041 RepID=A0A0F5L1C4_9HYPH|nr:hypothetical protein [Devosia soli]KKB76005.1 hypothetical protein VW35_19955 [Devosia soli]